MVGFLDSRLDVVSVGLQPADPPAVSHLAPDHCGQVLLSHLGGSSTWLLFHTPFTDMGTLQHLKPLRHLDEQKRDARSALQPPVP